MKFFKKQHVNKPPVYLATTRPRVRRVVTSQTQRKMTATGQVRTNFQQYVEDEVGQNIAHTELTKAQRASLPRRLNARSILVWGSWGIAMGIFAGSLLGNAPFPLGSLLLEALPGSERIGSFAIEAPKESVADESFTADIVMSDLSDFVVDGVNLTLGYDPLAIELVEIKTEGTPFEEVVTSEFDSSSGIVRLVLKNLESESEGPQKIASLSFLVRPFAGETSISLDEKSFVFADNEVARIPKELTDASVGVLPKPLPPVEVAIAEKLEPVTIDGNFDDWRDVIDYNLASFDPQGTVVDESHIVDGTLESLDDAGGILQVASDGTNYYGSFFAVDEDITEGDYFGITLGAQTVQTNIRDVLEDKIDGPIEIAAVEVEGGFNIEFLIKAESTLLNGEFDRNINIEIIDQDTTQSARLLLSSPQNSFVEEVF